jgi:hypothetical protein
VISVTASAAGAERVDGRARIMFAAIIDLGAVGVSLLFSFALALDYYAGCAFYLHNCLALLKSRSRGLTKLAD